MVEEAKSIEAKKVTQKVRKDMSINVDIIPEKILNYYTENFIGRNFAYLVAEGVDGKYRLVKCDLNGKLQTSTFIGAYDDYGVLSGVGDDTYTSTNTYYFSEAYTNFIILIEENEALISLRNPSKVWGGDIPIKLGYFGFEFNMTGIRVKNRYSGQNTKYAIILLR